MTSDSKDIKEDLERKDVVVSESESTIRRRLNEVGAKFSLPMSKPMLTEKHCLNRLKWASVNGNGDTDWDQVIFLMRLQSSLIV